MCNQIDESTGQSVGRSVGRWKFPSFAPLNISVVCIDDDDDDELSVGYGYHHQAEEMDSIDD